MQARLAQSVEHETLNLRVVGSSPTLGEQYFDFAYFKETECVNSASSFFVFMKLLVNLLFKVAVIASIVLVKNNHII